MARIRYLAPFLAAPLLWTAQLGAQNTGTITGRVLDSSTQQPIPNASVTVLGTRLGILTQTNGVFLLTGVPAGSHRVRATQIGYAQLEQPVTVSAGGTSTVQFALEPQAVALAAVVAVGYGTRRREAITSSITTVNATAADVGVVANADQLLQGRAAGVAITQNSGEPGAGVQIRIRGGTSISASNEPLYVIDGVPIDNVNTEPDGIGIGGTPALARNPLNLLNPSDILSITVLKDAAAAAIYGSRAANGVVLVETKQGSAGKVTMEYDGYVAAASPAKYLDVLSGDQYRAFIQQQVSAGVLSPDRLTQLGNANTNWERAITHTSLTQNHNLSFSGGTQNTRYRASLNYMDNQGVVIDNGFRRVQGRLIGEHQTLNERLRLTLNLMGSQVTNKYLPYENSGGFEGGVFENMVTFNPTRPVTVMDSSTGQTRFYEIGPGSQSSRNPVAIAKQVDDQAITTRTLGNAKAEMDLLPGLTGQVNVGVDRSTSLRQTYFPRSSPVGAVWNGRADQVSRNNSAVTLQTLLTYHPHLPFAEQDADVTGGYEFAQYALQEFGAESQNFLTDAFTFNNLSGGASPQPPYSWRQDSRLVSFFGRANYSLKNRYFLTGVLRRDGSSRFGSGNKWALFPAISASWRLSEESFMRGKFFSDLRLRGGWGLQGNQAVPPYASLIVLSPDPGARYPFGETVVTGVVPTSNANPNLKWEQTAQTNAAVDFGFLNNRFTGSVEYYVKNTKDLLLTVNVPQPAAVPTELENIGKVRNKGVEASLDGRIMQQAHLSWQGGLVFAAERNKVVDLGGQTFISTGYVSGQGQSGQVSQRIMPGFPLGTFYGPEFVSVDRNGKQLFNHYTVTRDAQGHVTKRVLSGQTDSPSGDDFVPLGDANPSFTVGVHSQATWHSLDASLLIRGEQGGKVFNNTALVYSTKGNALQNKNFLASALNDPTGIHEPAIFSSRWIEDRSFVRLQNVTVGYTLTLPSWTGQAGTARIYVSGDNLMLLTHYSGYDPEVFTSNGLATRGLDYLVYPRARTISTGVHFTF